MNAVIVRSEKQSKAITPSGVPLINRSTTPPKVQFVPVHINIWAPQAQQQLLKQHGSKSSRPQSAHGTVHKGLPMTAVSLQRVVDQNLSRPTSAPVLTFSRPDSPDSNTRLINEMNSQMMRSHNTSDHLSHNTVIEEMSKTLGPLSNAKNFSDNQHLHFKPQQGKQSEHSKLPRPITPDSRGQHLGSIAQHSQKRPMSSQNPDRSAKFVSSTSQQKQAEIETFDSGGDSDTETFAHTKLSSTPSRPSSSASKQRDHSKIRRPNFGMPASVSDDAEQRKSEIFERFSKTFVKVEDFAAFAGKSRFRSPGVKLEAALLERLQSITQPNARAVIFAELFEDVISKDLVYGSVLRHIKNEYDALITPSNPSELANKYHQLMSNHRVATADLELARQEVMQLQELLSAARAEVQIRGSNIQILEENLAARRRRDVALTVADDEGQTVMESMRRQVEQLTLENERLQKELKEALLNAGAASDTNWRVDDDGDGMERAAQLSTLTMDAQRPSSASSKIYRKSQEASSLHTKAALPSAQAAPLLQFTPGSVQHAQDKYSNDFDFSLKARSQQPPIPPPLPIYNGEIMQAPSSATLQKQSGIKGNLVVQSSNQKEPAHTADSQFARSSVVRVADVESSVVAPASAILGPSLSKASAELRPKVNRHPSAPAAAVVPAISVGVVKASQGARPPSAGDRASDRSQSSDRSAFSVSEANDGYDVVAELSRGLSMRRVLRPDFVPALTVDAALKDTAGKDNDDTDSEQSYSYLTTEGEQWTLDVSPIASNFL